MTAFDDLTINDKHALKYLETVGIATSVDVGRGIVRGLLQMPATAPLPHCTKSLSSCGSRALVRLRKKGLAKITDQRAVWQITEQGQRLAQSLVIQGKRVLQIVA